MTRRLGVAQLATLLTLTLVAAPTVASTPTPASGPTWEPNQAVPFRWKDGAVPPAWMKTAIKAAATDSNASRGARAAILSYDAGAKAWVAYTADIPTTYAVGYAVRNVPTSFNVRLRPHGYVLDWGKLRWCEYYDNPPDGCYDAEMITLHEFGHVQTLGHADESKVDKWNETVMHEIPKTKPRTGWNKHSFGVCDVARLQIRYDVLSTTTSYSTCLSVPTDLTVAASSTSVGYDGSVKFTANLRVADSAPYAKLVGNKLSQRTVTLQRRVPGTASWSSVTDMAPVSGVAGAYSASQRVTATYEWRARFAATADEGLEASTSNVTMVNVSTSCTSGCGCSSTSAIQTEAFYAPLAPTC
jgi:hypothetical protein